MSNMSCKKFNVQPFFNQIGKGPLQTTMAVIDAARRISEAGTQLDKLARQIADQCPESSTKKDLIAYLQRIALYCHQLNITSKVCLGFLNRCHIVASPDFDLL